MTHPRKGTVLILGGSGRFGRHATSAFQYRGWEVRQFDRASESLWDAAWGADVIVNAWNPLYPDWARDVPKFTAEIIEVAKASKATVLLPGNVYVYGEDSSDWDADTPHLAQNPLGRIRIEMEAAYRAAGIPTIILRAGDFLDTEATNTWFDRIMTTQLKRGVFTYPGDPDTPHAWAWLPDVAEAAVTLAERRADLPRFADIPFEGYTLTGRDMARAMEEVLARPLKVRQMNWTPLRLLATVWPLASCLVEMRYLWNHPHRLKGDRLAAIAPELRATPLQDALSLALKDHIHPNQPVTAARLSFGT